MLSIIGILISFFADPVPATNPPGFAFYIGETFTQVAQYVQTGESYVFENNNVKGTVKRLNTVEWELELRSKSQPITKIWFPWEANSTPLDDSIDDDVIYSTFLAGQSQKMANTCNFCWEGLEYPGLSFSPLVIVADNNNARLVAATNWPPKRVKPLFSLNRVGMNYDTETILPNSLQTYRVMYFSVDGDTSKGRPPWYLASKAYRAWLVEHLTDAGLWPIKYSDEIRKVHGFLNIGLNNMTEYNEAQILAYWNQFKDKINWMQFWGQMSNYGGPPALAKPPLQPGEQVGCCLDQTDLHVRYAGSIPTVAQKIKDDGGLVGFYSRPRSPNEVYGLVSEETNLNYLLSWIKKNQSYGANAYYVDVFGALYFGPGLTVANIAKEFPPNTFVEYPVELYPTAFSISGSLTGIDPNTGPGKTLENSTRVPFPRLCRSIMPEHLIFMGGVNGDHVLVGPNGNYWSERQAFLLGCKLDVLNMTESGDFITGTVNKAIDDIIRLRNAADWWNLNPEYLDVLNVSNVPTDIEIRRFRARNGVHLYVIENWKQLPGLWFVASGRKIDIPTEKMSIVKIVRDNDVIGGVSTTIK